MAHDPTDRDTSPNLRLTTEPIEPPDDDAIDAHEVARLLRIGLKSVYEGAARHQIPHRKVLGRYLFSRRAIKTWLASRTGF